MPNAESSLTKALTPAADGAATRLEAPDSRPPELGRRLLEARRARRLSRARVAKETGLSASFLALVEQGKSDISVGRLGVLIRYYCMRLADVLPDLDEADPVVVRAQDQQRVPASKEGIDWFLLASSKTRLMLPGRTVYQPGATHEHPGWESEEFIHVISGRLELRLRDREPILLETGDTAYYPSTDFISTSNPGPDEAHVITAVSPAPV